MEHKILDGPEKRSVTWQTGSKPPSAEKYRDACLVHIYPTGPAMGTRYVLGAEPVVLGRSEECDIRIDDHSVSRRHALIEPCSSGYVAVDLQSTNGTFVNERSATFALLKDGDYFRVGNCIYRFLAGGNVEAAYHEEIYRMAIVDGLTGIHNRRYLEEFLVRELVRSQRHRRPLALILFDIDDFKAVNDRLGHLGGDHCLRELAACLRVDVRQDELFARYGGEEFAVVVVETDLDAALLFAERIRQQVDACAFEYEGQPLRVTVSLGVATTDGAEELSAEAFLRRADEKLFEAKRQGRNRVVG